MSDFSNTPQRSPRLSAADTPPSQAPDLCRECSELVFNPRATLFSSRNPFAQTQKAMLGRLDEIQSRSCPFCALIAHAVFEIQRSDALILEPGQEIGVWWGENTGLSGFNLLFKGKGNSRGTIISILATNPATTPRPQTNPPVSLPRACLREVHRSEISIDRAQRWVKHCRDHHSQCRAQTVKGAPIPTVFPGLEVIRLIDVRERCLIETDKFMRYTTLSYVWGHTSSLRLTRANMTQLSEPGGLEKRWTLLARTIRDAIDLVDKMGERYLWVDSLCLVQNDPADLKLGTAVMDLVYAQSTLTVIAASGHDANAGLPGVHHGTRYPSQELRVVRPGLTMGVHTTLTDLVKRTVYSTRAWTYQEQHLSRRSLYFIDNQVFFRCAEATFSENTLDSASCRAKPYESEFQQRPGRDRSTAGFVRTVSEYSTKTLTYQGDVLRAMSGIIRRLSFMMRCDWFSGAPSAIFDVSMLFTSPNLLRRRKEFPSYSWTGWVGCAAFELPLLNTSGAAIGGPTVGFNLSSPEAEESARIDGVNGWLRTKTWIIWYRQDGQDRRPRLVWDPEDNPDFPFHDMSYVGYRQRSSFELQSLGEGRFPTKITAPSRAWQATRAFPNYPILRFWTLTVVLRVRISDTVRGIGQVLNRFGRVCGTLRIDGFEETTAFESEEPFQFVILSRTTSDSRIITTFGPQVNAFNSMFYALCVEWGGGIAERRGLGVVTLESIDQSFSPGPMWQEIFLA